MIQRFLVFRRRHRWRVDAGIGAIIAALIGAGALLIAGAGDERKASACDQPEIRGSHNRLNCTALVNDATVTDLSEGEGHDRGERSDQRSEQEIVLEGQAVPVVCQPEGEQIVQQAATTLEVHVWCSQLLGRRDLVQTKLKVWASNPTERRMNVALGSFYLLVPGAEAAADWSAPPGVDWPGPTVLNLPDGRVTAIPANPDGAAEDLGPIEGGRNYSFATHWEMSQPDFHGDRVGWIPRSHQSA